MKTGLDGVITSLSALEISDQYQAFDENLRDRPDFVRRFLIFSGQYGDERDLSDFQLWFGNVTVLYGTGIVGRCVDSGGNPIHVKVLRMRKYRMQNLTRNSLEDILHSS